MKKELVIFGSGQIAEIANYYFSETPDYKVVAFTVDEQYREADTFCGLPVVPFREVETAYPPKRFRLFVALSYSKLNAVRKEKYEEAKAKGYQLASYVSPYATMLNGGCIGENCFIFEDNTVQPFVNIGNNVTLWSGNHIGHHSLIGDHCFVASHAVISGGVDVGEQCFIGVNATLRDNIKIGARCVIGAGTLILSDAPPDGLYAGTATERAKAPSSKVKSI